MKRNKIAVKILHSDRIFDAVNILLMCILLLIFVWPLWFVLIASVSDPSQVWLGNVVLLPKKFTMIAYKAVLDYGAIWIGYRNTIFYTVVGTILNLVMTICAAYPLSRKEFMPRNVLMFLFMLTMYFSGGLIFVSCLLLPVVVLLCISLVYIVVEAIWRFRQKRGMF